MKKWQWIKFILSTIFVIGLYSLITLPFEVPDENAHFATVHFLNHQYRMPKLSDQLTLSYEEQEVERLFGVMEHENKYSYHPEYRIEQIPGNIGKYEDLIQSLNTVENRTNFTFRQAAVYPPLYYYLTLPFYKLVNNADIITRIFVSRLPSVIMTVGTVIIAYIFGKLAFGNPIYAVTLSTMALLFPMTSYIGGGVNPDNLHNLLFSTALTLAIYMIRNGFNPSTAILSGIVIGLDLLTKPQAFILLPIFVAGYILRGNKINWRSIIRDLILVGIPILCIAGLQEINKIIAVQSGSELNPYFANTTAYGGWDNFTQFTSNYLRTNAKEMIVWYWGVFKWFGVLMPRLWWWVANRLVFLAGLGIIWSLYLDWLNREFSWNSKLIIFCIIANFIYGGALFWFDWQFYQQFGRSLGLQARYYMPLLVTQMYLMLFGLTRLGWNPRIREYIRIGLVMFFIGLQFASLWTQLSAYYDTSSVAVFINHLSQYKPVYAKGNWWYLWFSLYAIGIIGLVKQALSSDTKHE